ncbi:hypothetical protein BLA24_20735 [Streptomyces cinnamoneus]|uniref:Uncharacterized protein n=1 Tax=Streptomyces cinnamoneus TaxID=53446 RepID=A0A2G1XFN6_STRCJ|nr:hypothetical protein [Streptomyces cinnamoneus]PHQ50037.1 hypothetical protein BLA24_20735 [Streptomyces cinnamoneus]PPT13185.1 hypothetical protein CYQ11_10045 [Streptomyces cinnamoneus]
MKILGLHQETWPSAPGAVGSIRDDVTDSPCPDEKEIASYLRGGHVLFASMGVVDDVLGSGESIVGGGSLFTDGEWVWRGDLWFYVTTYHLLLPDEFVNKARAAGFHVPAVEQDRLIELTDEIQAIRSKR